MKRMKQILSVSLALLFVTAFDSTASAQILSRGDLFGPGAPPPMAGVMVALGQHSQQGTFNANCGCTFENGSGSGFLGMAFFELPLDYEWAVGLMVGPDFKKYSTNSLLSENAVVQTIQNSKEVVDTLSLQVQRVGDIKATYLSFLPYVQYQFFRMGPFLQGGINVGYLMSSHFQQTRELINDSGVLSDGTRVENLRFTNGTKTESLQEQKIADVNKIRLGLVISAGYNLAVSERSVFSPLLSYDFPLTTISNTNAQNWKIGSLYASAMIKFKLD